MESRKNSSSCPRKVSEKDESARSFDGNIGGSNAQKNIQSQNASPEGDVDLPPGTLAKGLHSTKSSRRGSRIRRASPRRRGVDHRVGTDSIQLSPKDLVSASPIVQAFYPNTTANLNQSKDFVANAQTEANAEASGQYSTSAKGNLASLPAWLIELLLDEGPAADQWRSLLKQSIVPEASSPKPAALSRTKSGETSGAFDPQENIRASTSAALPLQYPERDSPSQYMKWIPLQYPAPHLVVDSKLAHSPFDSEDCVLGNPRLMHTRRGTERNVRDVGVVATPSDERDSSDVEILNKLTLPDLVKASENIAPTPGKKKRKAANQLTPSSVKVGSASMQPQLTSVATQTNAKAILGSFEEPNFQSAAVPLMKPQFSTGLGFNQSASQKLTKQFEGASGSGSRPWSKSFGVFGLEGIALGGAGGAESPRHSGSDVIRSEPKEIGKMRRARWPPSFRPTGGSYRETPKVRVENFCTMWGLLNEDEKLQFTLRDVLRARLLIQSGAHTSFSVSPLPSVQSPGLTAGENREIVNAQNESDGVSSHNRSQGSADGQVESRNLYPREGSSSEEQLLREDDFWTGLNTLSIRPQIELRIRAHYGYPTSHPIRNGLRKHRMLYEACVFSSGFRNVVESGVVYLDESSMNFVSQWHPNATKRTLSHQLSEEYAARVTKNKFMWDKEKQKYFHIFKAVGVTPSQFPMARIDASEPVASSERNARNPVFLGVAPESAAEKIATNNTEVNKDSTSDAPQSREVDPASDNSDWLRSQLDTMRSERDMLLMRLQPQPNLSVDVETVNASPADTPQGASGTVEIADSRAQEHAKK